MPSKRMNLQSSDSDAPIVVTPRKNTTSLSALLAQDVLLSRAASKQAPRVSSSGMASSPATPSHAANVASPSAAPPKLAKIAAAAARRRASNPRVAGMPSAASKTTGPVAEISSSSFYPTKDAEWTKRCHLCSQRAALILRALKNLTLSLTLQVGKNRGGCCCRREPCRQQFQRIVRDPFFAPFLRLCRVSHINRLSYLTRVKLVARPFPKPVCAPWCCVLPQASYRSNDASHFFCSAGLAAFHSFVLE